MICFFFIFLFTSFLLCLVVCLLDFLQTVWTWLVCTTRGQPCGYWTVGSTSWTRKSVASLQSLWICHHCPNNLRFVWLVFLFFLSMFVPVSYSWFLFCWFAGLRFLFCLLFVFCTCNCDAGWQNRSDVSYLPLVTLYIVTRSEHYIVILVTIWGNNLNAADGYRRNESLCKTNGLQHELCPALVFISLFLILYICNIHK